jgi:hypothetical protein
MNKAELQKEIQPRTACTVLGLIKIFLFLQHLFRLPYFYEQICAGEHKSTIRMHVSALFNS